MDEEDKKKIKEKAIPIRQIIKKYKELRKLKEIKTKNNPEILKYFEVVKVVCERYGIIISDEVLDLNLYEYNDRVSAHPDDPKNKKKYYDE